MRFLVDANVLSEGTKPEANPDVMKWLVQHEDCIVVNPIILGELHFGILQLPAGKKRTALLDWFQAGVTKLASVGIDSETSHYWATLLAHLRRSGRAMPVKDSLIAASALQHGLTIATRNTSDFEHAGVLLSNPFKSV